MTTFDHDLMTVSEISRRTGMSVKNVRQYTDWGLIYSVGRSGSGYRLFDADALWCIDLISKLRSLGITVAEIRTLGRSRRAGQPIGPLLTEQLRVARARIAGRITELQQTVHAIDDYVATHQAELADPTTVCWAGDPRCSMHA